MKVEFLPIIFNVLGGLGIFMLGMRYMSDGIQNVSGVALRRLIDFATANKYLATLVGILVTFIVQSSSITTVITVGLVNSGVMQLTQALGVVLGANIGTTITGWILVIKIGQYGLPILGLFSLVYLFVKSEKMRFISMAVMGIGMIFFGLELMAEGFKPFRKMPEFKDFFAMFNAGSYLGVLGCALVGCILTLIVQSSSATLGITLVLVGQGIINMEAGAALVLGENVGTTITAYLAAIGAGTNAKRTAYFHIMFNLFGAFWATALFSFFIIIIRFTLSTIFNVEDFNLTVMDEKDSDIYHNRQLFVSTTHSMFNILNVMLFLPFLAYFNQMLLKLVKDKKEIRKTLTRLEFKIGESPLMQIEQSQIEIEKMGAHTKSMLTNLAEYYRADSSRKKALSKQIFESEDILDVVKKEITTFVTHLMQQTLNSESAVQCREQLIIADEYETISDYITQILKLQLKIEESKLNLDDNQIKEVIELCEKIKHCFDWVLTPGRDMSDKVRALKVTNEGKELILLIKNMRSESWEIAAKEKRDPLLITSYADMIVAYRKVVYHLVTIAETMAESE